MLLFGTAFSWAANQINGDGTSSWTSTSSTTTIKAGDYLQLRDMKITFGDAEDTNTSWTWHGGNSGMIPNQMPSTDGTKILLLHHSVQLRHLEHFLKEVTSLNSNLLLMVP